MKKTMKKILCSLIVVVMCITSMPFVGLDFKAGATDYKVGDIIEFGSYPQTQVTDSTIISALNSISATWRSYGYMSGSGSNWCDGSAKESDYMKYKDVTYDNERYRAVEFSTYRPGLVTFKSAETCFSYQADNGYKINNVYWFKFEPIQWRILDPNKGLVLCNSVIDSQAFNNNLYATGNTSTWWADYWKDSARTIYANNYTKSDIKEWLNDDFYYTAFTEENRKLINTQTDGKVCLLTRSDTTNASYGFINDESRKAYGTDYAKAQGLRVSDGTSIWMTQSAASSLGINISCVYFDGHVFDRESNDYGHTSMTFQGVRPVICVDLDTLFEDTDGDGLLDQWEINGVDTNNDGIIDLKLNEMGADPNIPDIFVEVDWMVRSKSQFLWWETASARSMAPSQNAMRMVYDAFREHNINLHIDVGPSSVDFVTGKTWGELSGGNEIEYVKSFDTDRTKWATVVSENFERERRIAFKHCIFVDTYDDTTSSGLAIVSGQYFIIANQDWVYEGGDISVAGTFMHELGHTLGLEHGGDDDTNYKPNYLSVMNYLFQTTGLVGTNAIDYSNYELPDLNESNLNENNGVDPHGVTEGTGLGTKWYHWGFSHTVNSIANMPIDFNCNDKIDSDVYVNLNSEDERELSGGFNDWNNLIFNGGSIGDLSAISSGIDLKYEEVLSEKTLEESLKTDTLGDIGTAYISCKNITLLSSTYNQKITIDISNRSAKEYEVELKVKCDGLMDEYNQKVILNGSVDSISQTSIDIPVKPTAQGEYEVECTLTYDDHTSLFPIIVKVYEPTDKELSEMKELIKNGVMEDILLKEQIENSISNYEISKDCNNNLHTLNSDGICENCGIDVTDNCSCNCHASGIKKFFFKLILFFQKLFKKNAVCACGVAHY